LGASVHTIKKNTDSLLVGCKEIGLEVNVDKTKYMVMYQDHNVGRSQNIASLKGWMISNIWEQP